MGSLNGDATLTSRRFVYPLTSSSNCTSGRYDATVLTSPTTVGFPRTVNTNTCESSWPSKNYLSNGSQVPHKSRRDVEHLSLKLPFIRTTSVDRSSPSPDVDRFRRLKLTGEIDNVEMYRTRPFISVAGGRASLSSTSRTSSQPSCSGSILKKRPNGAKWETGSLCSSLDKYSTDGNVARTLNRQRSNSATRLRQPSTGTVSGSTSSQCQPSRRVLFKNNVSVYRFDSDGSDSAGYSSSASESNEQLDGQPRRHRRSQHHRQHHRRHRNRGNDCHLQQQQEQQHQRTPEYNGIEGNWFSKTHPVDSAASWTTAADSSRRDSRLTWQSERQLRSPHRSSTGTSRYWPQQSATTTIYIGGEKDQIEQKMPVGSRSSALPEYNEKLLVRPNSNSTSDDGCGDVLSCGSLAVHNSRFIAYARFSLISVFVDGNKRLELTCGIRSTMASQCNSENIIVKTNRNGNRARVVVIGQTDDRDTDNLLLPVVVNPYQLSAQLLENHTLVITAPL